MKFSFFFGTLIVTIAAVLTTASSTFTFPPSSSNRSANWTAQQRLQKLELARLSLDSAAHAIPNAAETLVNAAANAAVDGASLNAAAAEALQRKEQLLAAAMATGTTTSTTTSAEGKGSGAWKGKNVILFISDQESPLLHVPNPQQWEQENLPGVSRLKRHGVSFERAYSNACMCTAARATLFSGFYTTQNNARYVLERSMPASQYPQVELPPKAELPNLATVAELAGFSEGVIYKGKMHLTKAGGDNHTWTSADAAKYGFSRWNYPDAGADQSLPESGGSPAFNDKRFMESVGDVGEGKEGVFQFLRERAASARPLPSSPPLTGNSTGDVAKKPFFLVISLVNPHDVLFYPLQFAASGYDPSLLQGDVQLPPTYNENLLTKPRAQREWVALNLATGSAPRNASQARDYLNFYANLIKQTDSYLNATLSLLDELGLTNDTVVIKTADHGEMAMSHGGQIQKMFNFYEESLRVPLIFSNPVLYPEPLNSSALVSHVDFVPTVAELLVGKAKASALRAAAGYQGVSYADAVADPRGAAPPQEEVVFLFDDYQFGQPLWPGYPFPPNHIRSIVEERWKYAEYYDPTGQAPPEYEMYDLLTDPNETVNLAFHDPNFPQSVTNGCGGLCADLTPEQLAQRQRLRAKLQQITETKLRPRLGVKWPVNLTSSPGSLARGTVLVQATALSRSDAGAIEGQPVGGYPWLNGTGGATVQLSYDFVVKPSSTYSNSSMGPLSWPQPCVADVAWSVFSGAGTILGAAKGASCRTAANGGVEFWSSAASIYAGTASFRGLRAQGLEFAATSPPLGSRGSVSIVGVAVTKSLAAA